MAEITNKIKNVKLSPNIMRDLGLQKDWTKGISSEFAKKVEKTAQKYRGTLKELSKY